MLEKKLQQEKNEKKQFLEEFKNQVSNNVVEKRNEIVRKCKERKENLQMVQVEKLKKSFKVHQSLKKEKQQYSTQLFDLKSQELNQKNFNYLKIKQEIVEGKANRFKSKIEKEEELKLNYQNRLNKQNQKNEKLKEKLRMLEEKEYKYISKLKNTMMMKKKELDEISEIKLNSSLVEKSKTKNIFKEIRHMSNSLSAGKI